MTTKRCVYVAIGLPLLILALYIPRLSGLLVGSLRAAATIVFDNSEIYAGDVAKNGPPVESTFHFTNRGSRSVAIADVKSSCGCVTTGFSKGPVKPGERGFVTLRFSAEDRNGTVRNRALVTFTDDAVQPVSIFLQLNVHEPLTINPRLVDLGDFDKDAGAHGNAVLINKTKRPITLRLSPSEKGYVQSRSALGLLEGNAVQKIHE